MAEQENHGSSEQTTDYAKLYEQASQLDAEASDDDDYAHENVQMINALDEDTPRVLQDDQTRTEVESLQQTYRNASETAAARQEEADKLRAKADEAELLQKYEAEFKTGTQG